MLSLSSAEKMPLRKRAHSLKPIILIGKAGLTEAVQLELERALFDHELIKIKISASDEASRRSMIEKICTARQASLIQAVGHTAVIYRKKEAMTIPST
jgi:RNA-binding protein